MFFIKQIKYLLLLLITFNSYAKDLSNIIHVKKLYIETEKHIIANRDYYFIEGKTPNYGLNLGLKLEALNYLYMKNKITSRTDENQFRFIGLDHETGIMYNGLDVYFRHFSGHSLDGILTQRFPESNSIGIRFNFINKE